MTPETEQMLTRVLAKLETELEIRALARARAQAERDFYERLATAIMPPRPQPENQTGAWEKNPGRDRPENRRRSGPLAGNDEGPHPEADP